MDPTVTPADQHPCPVCTVLSIPVWRAMCADCFDIVPWKMRADLLHTYGRRILNYPRYLETVIEVRQWYQQREKRATGPKHRAKEAEEL